MPAVAALDLVIIAFCAAILAYAIWTLFRPVVLGALGALPLIGPQVARSTDVLLTGILNVAVPVVEAGILPLGHLIGRVWFAVFHFRTWTLFALDGSMFALYRLRDVTIPAARDAAISYAEGRIGWLTVYAQTLYWQGIEFAAAQGRAAIAYAEARIGWLTVYAQTLYWQGIEFAAAQGRAASSYAETLTQGAVQHADAVGVTAEDYARALNDGSIDYTRRSVAAAEDFARGIGADAEGYARALNDLTQGYARDLVGAEAAAAAAALGVVATAVRTLEDSPCQRFCSPLGDLGQLLQQVEELGLAGLLLLLAAEMAHDPRGTARTIDGLIGPEVRGIIGDLGQESGLRGAA